MNIILSYANKLESVLRKYLECNYSDFRVKANGYLDDTDWRSAVYFALGCKYGELNKSQEARDKIDSFLGNDFFGDSIADIIDQFDYYGFDSEETAYKYINNTINKIEQLLNS